MESSYTVAGVDSNVKLNPEATAKFGKDVGYSNPMVQKRNLKTPTWFAETPSAGEVDAWQTYYPSVKASVAGNRNVHNNHWRDTPQGWVNDYFPSPYTTQQSEAGPKAAG